MCHYSFSFCNRSFLPPPIYNCHMPMYYGCTPMFHHYNSSNMLLTGLGIGVGAGLIGGLLNRFC